MEFRGVQWLGLGLSCLFLIGSCQSNPSQAYPTASAVSANAKSGQGVDLAILEHGRKIFTTRCTECHVARTIANYSIPQWQHYISIMAPRAKLASDDRAALETYVLQARESLEYTSE